MLDLYDNILDLDDKDEPDGFLFEFIANFRVTDNKKGFTVEIHKLFKRSYKGFEKEINIIMQKNPIDIKDVYNVELSEFKMNKLHKGCFSVNFYENDTYDIFLKSSNII